MKKKESKQREIDGKIRSENENEQKRKRKGGGKKSEKEMRSRNKRERKKGGKIIQCDRIINKEEKESQN